MKKPMGTNILHVGCLFYLLDFTMNFHLAFIIASKAFNIEKRTIFTLAKLSIELVTYVLLKDYRISH